MDQRKDEVMRRPLYVYDLPQDILTTLTQKDDAEDGSQTDNAASPSECIPKPRIETTDGSKCCSLCGIAFHTVEEQRSHTRSDLHGYNLKQKIRGARTVTEGEFEKLIGDLDESLSGSDSSDTEDEEDGNARKETKLSALLKKQAAICNDNEDAFSPTKRKQGSGKAPILWFASPILPSNTYLGIYRAIFTNEEQGHEANILDFVRRKQLAPKPALKIPTNPSSGVPLPEAYKEPHIFLCMIGGGHFAAMVVSLTPKQTRSKPMGPLTKEATVLAHKTFHRYTTRRKQGGAQSSNDNAKGAAHSAGADLRRYNEQALVEEVRALLQDWKGMIDTSELMFVRATGSTNRRTLFGPYDGQVLRQNDARIRGFPFSTRRATQNELLRSFVELTRVKVLEVDEAAIAAAKIAAAEAAKEETTKAANKSTPAAPKLSEEEETALLHTAQLQAIIRRCKVPALVSYFKSNDISPDFVFQPPEFPQNFHAPTSLHLAASQNSAPLVTGLLAKAGADPTVVNGDGKTPFDLAGERATRDAFRVARSELGETKWDWEAAHVPAALSRADADKRDATEKKHESMKEEERRKAEEARLRAEGPKVAENGPLGRAAGRGRMLALGHVAKTAQEKREEEARGMTPEMRMRLDRERRARAAEERMKRIASGSDQV
ncbi:ankyrin repeat and zinc finger domain-containing protein [Diplocarpon rosae]|nr:ankyrin repeat and zinc finger domain-containing protein [Diplocarpon rosae]